MELNIILNISIRSNNQKKKKKNSKINLLPEIIIVYLFNQPISSNSDNIITFVAIFSYLN